MLSRYFKLSLYSYPIFVSLLITISEYMRKDKSQTEYITKRLVARQSKLAFRQKAQDAMKLVGHTVVAEAGWIVRKEGDGRVTKLKEIEFAGTASRKLVLDK